MVSIFTSRNVGHRPRKTPGNRFRPSNQHNTSRRLSFPYSLIPSPITSGAWGANRCHRVTDMRAPDDSPSSKDLDDSSRLRRRVGNVKDDIVLIVKRPTQTWASRKCRCRQWFRGGHQRWYQILLPHIQKRSRKNRPELSLCMIPTVTRYLFMSALRPSPQRSTLWRSRDFARRTPP